mmetsp:Transcript_8967/g.15176  ORF Transcript_8967/g.15176 Transcript_8967/m.15176 type:complete len:220 (-) Transcript_8967:8-667(-)
MLQKLNKSKGDLAKQKKQKLEEEKNSKVVKDLFGNIIEQPYSKGNKGDKMSDGFDDSELGDSEEVDQPGESIQMANNLMDGFYDDQNSAGEKSYTLTMICDPEDSGLDEKFGNYRQWLVEKENQQLASNRPQRLIISASQNGQAGKQNPPLLLNPGEDERFRRNNEQVGKIVFLKDTDIKINAFEKEISQWVSEFYYKMHQLCSRKPRFSEMRPNKFNV